jgi:DNA primase
VISFVPKPLRASTAAYLQEARKLTPQTIAEWEICELDGYSFRNRVCFPIRDVYGEVVSIAGRSLLPEAQLKAEGSPKYWHIPYAKTQHLFGMHRAKHSIFEQNLAILHEGQFDVFKMHQYGFTMSVGLSGKTVSDGQLVLLSQYCERVVLMLDSDVTDEFLAVLHEKVSRSFSTFIVRVGTPAGKKSDPDTFCDEQGYDPVYRLISESLKPVQKSALSLGHLIDRIEKAAE